LTSSHSLRWPFTDADVYRRKWQRNAQSYETIQCFPGDFSWSKSDPCMRPLSCSNRTDVVSAPVSAGVPQVGSIVTFCVSATDPQGLPLTITYDYGDGSSDTLGKHVYSAAGVYPVVVTISDGAASATATFSLSIKEVANLWIKQQTIKTSAKGSQSWQANTSTMQTARGRIFSIPPATVLSQVSEPCPNPTSGRWNRCTEVLGRRAKVHF